MLPTTKVSPLYPESTHLLALQKNFKMLTVKASVVLALGIFAVACTAYDNKDIDAYHFHIYFFEGNERHETEFLDFRKATRAKIEDGFLSQCSLNTVIPGIYGPHPFGQYELCCNASSFPQAVAWHVQNHGNLSVLIHPLTVEDLDDHVGRASWIGAPVPLDIESPTLYPLLPKARPCPVYPEYADVIPGPGEIIYPPIPIRGTEDYRNISGLNLLDGNY